MHGTFMHLLEPHHISGSSLFVSTIETWVQSAWATLEYDFLNVL